MLALKPVVLHRVWDFLGAEYIRSDIHLALQSHAIEEKFNNLVSHVLNDDLARRYFDSVHFYSSTLAHPELSGRLQGALNLWDLGCVNKDLQEKCIQLLKVNGVALDDVVCASRPVLFHDVSQHYGHFLKAKRRFLVRLAFQNGSFTEQERERLRGLEFLEDRYKNLISMQWERLQTWKTLESQQESVHKRMYKGEVFNWEECVDLWGYHYEISKLYEWFVQLKKVD